MSRTKRNKKYNLFNSNPSWWNNLFYDRPRRMKERAFKRKILKTHRDNLDLLDIPKYHKKT